MIHRLLSFLQQTLPEDPSCQFAEGREAQSSPSPEAGGSTSTNCSTIPPPPLPKTIFSSREGCWLWQGALSLPLPTGLPIALQAAHASGGGGGAFLQGKRGPLPAGAAKDIQRSLGWRNLKGPLLAKLRGWAASVRVYAALEWKSSLASPSPQAGHVGYNLKSVNGNISESWPFGASWVFLLLQILPCKHVCQQLIVM